MTYEPGDIVELKSDRPKLDPILVTIEGRSGRYAGFEIRFRDGTAGIALDQEIKGRVIP